MSLPSVRPADCTAVEISSRAATLAGKVGREATLVTEAGRQSLLLQHRLERVVDGRTHLQASRNVAAPIGAIMNSCTSTSESACAPPLTIFIMGTGSRWALGPPT